MVLSACKFSSNHFWRFLFSYTRYVSQKSKLARNSHLCISWAVARNDLMFAVESEISFSEIWKDLLEQV